MKKILVLLAAAAVAAGPARAASPSPESVEKLLVLAKVDKVRDTLIEQLNRVIDQSFQQALQGRPASAEQQKALDALHRQTTEAVEKQLSWPAIKEIYGQAYADNFTQEEVDGLIAFYSSPAGRAFADKQPLVAKKTSTLMQGRMIALMGQVQSALADLLQSLESQGAATSPSPAAEAAAGPTHEKAPAPLHISEGKEVQLKDYLVTGKTTVFDFYSEYCPPCRALRPLMEKLHREHPDIAVVEVDINRPGTEGIDWQSPVAREFSLDSIPHLKVYNPDGTLKAEGDEARTLLSGWLDKS